MEANSGRKELAGWDGTEYAAEGRANSHSHRLGSMQPKRRQPATLVPSWLSIPDYDMRAGILPRLGMLHARQTYYSAIPAALTLGRTSLTTNSFYGHVLIYGRLSVTMTYKYTLDRFRW